MESPQASLLTTQKVHYIVFTTQTKIKKRPLLETAKQALYTQAFTLEL